MKKFFYEARDQSNNKITKATVQAESESEAARLLIDQGLTPLDIKEYVDKTDFLSRITGRITIKDRIVFTRQLSTLIGAGLPMAQSLRTVAEQTQNKKLQTIAQDITLSVEGGKTLAKSFAKYPEVFDAIFLALIGAGEMSGTLDESLQRIANQQEKDAVVMRKIKGAFTYPIIVLVVIFAVMAFMLFTVVPQVEKLYVDLHRTLPFITQTMVGIADFLTNFWWLMFIAIAFGAYFLVQYLKTEAGIKLKDTLKLNTPIVGKLLQKLYMARFARTGETLLGTGITMLDMLKLTSKAINNTLVEKSVQRSADKVKGGKALSEALRSESYVLPLIPQMIKIGEQSGKIDEMLGKAAQVYEDELDEQINTISTSIEPILMVVLALVAGSMIAAVLLPIYSLVNNLAV